MKYNLLLTQQCNLRCSYCYVNKMPATMSLTTAEKIVDFIFARTPEDETIHIGYFGGEPLLAFEELKGITRTIEGHPQFDPARVELAIVTNGTLFSDVIVRFVSDHGIRFGISCDGPPHVHDRFRKIRDGSGSAWLVDRTIRLALASLDTVLVNAVYRPETLPSLPETVDYLSELGVRHIYLNADYSAAWSPDDLAAIPDCYRQVADRYVRYYLAGEPRFISLIDSKITVILREGYAPAERCSMGKGEMAFTPDGSIYPCERLVGVDNHRHCIGHVDTGISLDRFACHLAPGPTKNRPCLTCKIRDYCMHWCGCSNYFATGYYNRVNEFICKSEKAAIQVAFEAFQELEQKAPYQFFDHISGRPQWNAVKSPQIT
jgi:uncharacterized protein